MAIDEEAHGGGTGSMQSITDDGQKFSYECWVKYLGDTPGTSDGYFMGRRGYHSGFRQFKGSYNTDFLNWSSNTSYNFTMNDYNSSLSTWYYLVQTMDSVADQAILYVNGEPFHTKTWSMPYGLRDYGSGDYYLGGALGNYSGNLQLGTAHFHSGILDAATVKRHFNMQKSRFGY